MHFEIFLKTIYVDFAIGLRQRFKNVTEDEWPKSQIFSRDVLEVIQALYNRIYLLDITSVTYISQNAMVCVLFQLIICAVSKNS